MLYVQMINKSLSDVTYQWNCYEKEGLSISVEPASGHLSKLVAMAKLHESEVHCTCTFVGV